MPFEFKRNKKQSCFWKDRQLSKSCKLNYGKFGNLAIGNYSPFWFYFVTVTSYD